MAKARVSWVIPGTWHPAQSARRVTTKLPPDGSRVETRGGDVTAIFLLIPAVLLALSAAGMVWIRVAAAEYRHNWSLTQEITRGTYRRR
jgi:hypothetical protein